MTDALFTTVTKLAIKSSRLLYDFENYLLNFVPFQLEIKKSEFYLKGFLAVRSGWERKLRLSPSNLLTGQWRAQFNETKLR
jgi:hypothetical protein